MTNPFNDYTKRMKAISSKRKKTDDDLMEMARIEWMASLYHTERKGYYMKAECIEAAMLAAAKDKKLGKAFQAAVSVPDDPVFHFEHESFCVVGRYSATGIAMWIYGMKRAAGTSGN